MFDRNVLFLAAVIAAFCLLDFAAAAGPASKSAGDFTFLVFPTRCFDNYISTRKFLDFAFDADCAKRFISKVLGYLIITGACVVKLPQIINFVSAGSVSGVSKEATYLDLLGYLLQSTYHLVKGSPFSAYGETLIITIQSIAIVLLVWGYDFPGLPHTIGVTVALAVATQQAAVLKSEQLAYIQGVVTLLFIVSRLWQIVVNYKQGGTGTLSVITLFMNFAGSAARIFTSSVEINSPEVMLSFIISAGLNLLLLFQWVYYAIANKGKKAVVAAAAAPAPAAAARKKTDEPAPEAKKEEAAAPEAAAASTESEAADAPPSSKKTSRRRNVGQA